VNFVDAEEILLVENEAVDDQASLGALAKFFKDPDSKDLVVYSAKVESDEYKPLRELVNIYVNNHAWHYYARGTRLNSPSPLLVLAARSKAGARVVGAVYENGCFCYYVKDDGSLYELAFSVFKRTADLYNYPRPR